MTTNSTAAAPEKEVVKMSLTVKNIGLSNLPNGAYNLHLDNPKMKIISVAMSTGKEK